MAMLRTRPRLALWIEPPHEPLLPELLASLVDEFELVAVGGDGTSGVSESAAERQIPFVDDLRRLTLEHPADWLLCCGRTDHDAEDLLFAAEHDRQVLTLWPPVGSLDELQRLGKRIEAQATRIHLAPLFTSGLGWSRAADPAEVFGRLDSLSWLSAGPPATWSLFTRLFEAWQLVLSHADMPEAIGASLSGDVGASPEHLRQLSGHLTVHGRLATRGACVLHLSDRGGPARRSMFAIGRDAVVRVDDARYELSGPDGQPLEPTSGDPGAETPSFHQQLLRAIRAQIKQPQSRPAPSDQLQAILGCCEATLLSTRTGQPESPARLLSLRT